MKRQDSFTERDIELYRRNAKNRKAWEERYKQYYARGQWIKWEAGNFYDLPQRLRGIAAI